MKARYIKEVIVNWDRIHNPQLYPYKMFKEKDFSGLQFNNDITFFVGDNGTGKSTLLEAIAVNYGLNPEGGSKNFDFSTKATHSELSKSLTLSKNVNAKDAFFLRAETFYNLATEIGRIDESLYDDYYGGDLHKMSHGESFLSLLTERLHGNGMYLLDEPEAALSPTGQLSMLGILSDLTRNHNSQFIIATHSPILIAYPGAAIYEFDETSISAVKYEDTMNYLLYKRVMNDSDWINTFLKM